MNASEQAAAVRSGAGLFRGLARSIVEVTGADRTRWLAGMISADVSELAPGPSQSGRYATLLTPQGRVVADLQVMLRPEAYWLDVATPAVPAVMERLSKYIVADAVELMDRTGDFERIGIEGPASDAVLARAGVSVAGLARDACAEVEIAETRIVAAAFGFSGEAALQFVVPARAASRVADALDAAGADFRLVSADLATLEILRIEAGVPRMGAELDGSVLPAEAGLERALSNRRCYTGQEIVERMRSRGQLSHRLVGLVGEGDEPLVVASEVRAEDKRVGEVTSSCVSPHAGAIALAFVRRAYAEAGNELAAGGRAVRVKELPFVPAHTLQRPA